MASLNKVLLIGNLTKDPELRYTPNGTAVANLRVAVNRKFKDRTGELKEDTCFVTVTAWDKQAEACNQYLQKGRPIFVEGILQSRSWDTPDGQKRSTIDVRAERIQFLGGAGQAKGGNGEPVPAEGDAGSDAVRPEDIAWEE
ncbi:MAG: single-stranded DNA-binding protein [Candidatus Omnitrophica bacterium]|nr:single-stranded DNA-binding protein [Candidatus Omnitrophota bacterium]